MYVAAAHAISADGSQIVFTEAEEAEEGAEESKTQLYVRRGIGTSSPESVRISAYQGTASGPEEPAAFLEASTDGRYVFFKSKAALTEEAYAGEAGHESESLYRYDTSTDTLTDLTPDSGHEREGGAEVQGMLGSSESGQVAYFAADAVLTGAEEGPRGETAQAEQPNIYRWQEGATPALSFVATLRGGEPQRRKRRHPQLEPGDRRPPNRGKQFLRADREGERRRLLGPLLLSPGAYRGAERVREVCEGRGNRKAGMRRVLPLRGGAQDARLRLLQPDRREPGRQRIDRRRLHRSPGHAARLRRAGPAAQPLRRRQPLLLPDPRRAGRRRRERQVGLSRRRRRKHGRRRIQLPGRL